MIELSMALCALKSLIFNFWTINIVAARSIIDIHSHCRNVKRNRKSCAERLSIPKNNFTLSKSRFMLILRIKVAINVYNLKQKSEGPKLGAWRKLIIIFLLSREFSVQFRNFLIKLEWLEDQTWPLKTAKLEKKNIIVEKVTFRANKATNRY